ncbi:MAG: glycosyltransferase family 1 protein [Geobacter sp.]|nr:glycosyltransferase family 1 protein [Geobacter sp.]
MRLVLDLQGAQSVGSRTRGIGRYSLSIAQAIARNRGKHEILIALNGLFPETIEPIRAAFDGLLPQENLRVWYNSGSVSACDAANSWRRAASTLIRESFLTSLQPDLVHISSLFEGYGDDAVVSISNGGPPSVVTLYDLIPLLNPEAYLTPNPSFERFYRHRLEHLKRADGWLAISDFAAAEATNILGLPETSVFPISTACDPIFLHSDLYIPNEIASHAPSGLIKPFVLYSGGADERKNLKRLIQAYAGLSPHLRSAHQLVFAGKMPDANVFMLQTIAAQVGLKAGELVFSGYVSDEQLAWLYRHCQLFVFPSWHEGFGLPVLEAMACGAPVIAANATSLPEVIENPEALFDPFSVSEITKKLTQGLTDQAFRMELTHHGRDQVKKFSWDISAQRAIAAFESVGVACGTKMRGVAKSDGVDSLIAAIGGLQEKVEPTERDVCVAAWAIAQNLPPSGPSKLFIDISSIIQQNTPSDIRQNFENKLKDLLDRPPAGYMVEPVFAASDAFGYRYAASLVAQLSGSIADGLENVLIETHCGDVFLCLGAQYHAFKRQELYLDHLYRTGIQLYFTISYLPQDVGLSDAAGEYNDLLRIITKYTGTCCSSPADAEELRIWCGRHAAPRQRPYRIEVFSSAPDVGGSSQENTEKYTDPLRATEVVLLASAAMKCLAGAAPKQ